MQPAIKEPGSFRDRSNRVFYQDGRVFRALSPEALEDWSFLKSKSFFKTFSADGKVVSTQVASLANLPESERGWWAGVLEHGHIPFISYPYEWCFGMLRDAALLHLELLSAALPENMVLKDATAYNVQWKGSQPVFIDIPSFTPWSAGYPWVGYRQFCELFLFPLLLQAYRDISFQSWLRGSLEGISVEECSHLLRRDFYRPGVLKDVLLHNYFQRHYSTTPRSIKEDLRQTGFHRELIQANVARLSKIVSGLTWRTLSSPWNDYGELKHYVPEDKELKRAFVEQVLQSRHRRLVWDLGCNEGAFSRLAAEYSDYVVAVDSDPKVIEVFYQSLKKQNSPNILPLVMNLANVSSGLGWRGQERKAFVDRGKPDLILCLALMHHVTITANIPLAEWIQWLSSLGEELLIEFVSPHDPMVQILLRNKEGEHELYDKTVFESLVSQYFRINQQLPLKSGYRILYACSRKG